MGFLDTIKAQQAELSNAEVAADVPRISFYHGVKQAGSAGFFFIKASGISEQPGAPWQSVTNAYDEPGFAAETIRIAPIATHELWITEGADGKAVQHPQYVDGAKSNYRILAFVEGISQPCIVSASGKFKGGALKQIVQSHARGLIRAAQDATGGNIPLHTFWLPIGTRRGATGKPEYVPSQPGDKQGAMVTPPVAVYPAGTPDELMESLFVGDALLLRGESEKRALRAALLPRPAELAAAPSMPALPMRAAGRNVPQPLTEAEMDTAVTVVMAAPAAPVKRAVKLPSQSAAEPDLDW